MRTTISIRGARENNLQGVDVEIPRDQLVVVTGVSGSGKSSLAFDTLYAEGQRRLMASMSSWARRFVRQLKKPDVDFINGLSPVVSIDQKTVSVNPRSTIGTMTDISDFLRMLYSTAGQPHCPCCAEPLRVLSVAQMVEHLYTLPVGSEVEVRAPVERPWAEPWEIVLEAVRSKGYRRGWIDGSLTDLGGEVELDDERDYRIEAVIDNFCIAEGREREMQTSLEHGLELGQGFLSFHPGPQCSAARRKRFAKNFGCRADGMVAARMHHAWFTFNDPAGACPTCAGLGTTKRAYLPLIVRDPLRSLREGALAPEALTYKADTWGGRILFSLAQAYGFDLDQPWQDLTDAARKIVLDGTQGKVFKVCVPPEAKRGQHYAGHDLNYNGVVGSIERQYQRYRKTGGADAWQESRFNKLMVEDACPACEGARLHRLRRLVHVGGQQLAELGELALPELREFLQSLEVAPQHRSIVQTIVREVCSRLDVLIEIGLDYLNLSRRAATLSGGESQRIRLSSQIGSGLMGMLYVLDEPSIGLHPKDNQKMIRTLRRLRDIGNTVVVVEHDDETIRAADFVIEMGPGPGIHGGELVVAGPLQEVLAHESSPTALYLSGRRRIPLPKKRRAPDDRWLRVRGARENNLAGIDASIPLGIFTCVTGASGSGKSSLVHEIIFKRLRALLHDNRVLYGAHDALEGWQSIDDVIHVDQRPIGHNSRSNPATYIGFYDRIRGLFAATPEAKKRGYKPARFSFNVKGGRCEECSGAGRITTSMSFMPDIEVGCPVCKGQRYHGDTLEILWQGHSIAGVLDMSVEDGVAAFASVPAIQRKLKLLDELGLGYLSIGHPATILSGGEAQRVKLASELSKLKRGKHNLYILDEPTTGLHLADIHKLLAAIGRLVDRGHSVLVIEHNLEVIKTADWVLDLGPEGGHKGGQLVASGTPEQIAAHAASHTGRHLRPYLQREPA